MTRCDFASRVAFTSVDVVTRVDWESLARTFLDYNYRQTWAYGAALARLRRAISEHVAIRRGDEVIGLADVRMKRMPLIGGGMAFISGGPLTRRGISYDMNCLSDCLQALVREYIQSRKMTLRIASPANPSFVNVDLSSCLMAAGFSETERSPANRTLLLDIRGDEGEIRKNMAQKWRNCLNASERQNLHVNVGTDGLMFDRFNQMLKSLVARKGFTVELDGLFYTAVQRDTPEFDKLVIGLVRCEEELHAGGVFAMHGDTCVYLLGATTESGLKTKASYLLQWRIIQQAKARGMRWYDQGGIDPEKNPGVYRFKKGLGGEDITDKSYEQQPGAARAMLIRGAERLYLWSRNHLLSRV